MAEAEENFLLWLLTITQNFIVNKQRRNFINYGGKEEIKLHFSHLATPSC
jgi:hypothetical protein